MQGGNICLNFILLRIKTVRNKFIKKWHLLVTKIGVSLDRACEIIVSIVYFHKTIFSAVLLRRAVHVQTVSSRFVNGKFQPLKKKNFM